VTTDQLNVEVSRLNEAARQDGFAAAAPMAAQARQGQMPVVGVPVSLPKAKPQASEEAKGEIAIEPREIIVVAANPKEVIEVIEGLKAGEVSTRKDDRRRQGMADEEARDMKKAQAEEKTVLNMRIEASKYADLIARLGKVGTVSYADLSLTGDARTAQDSVQVKQRMSPGAQTGTIDVRIVIIQRRQNQSQNPAHQ
jgi:hypothetical protein